jgi:tetratricopeptide (TPR) repeat protein
MQNPVETTDINSNNPPIRRVRRLWIVLAAILIVVILGGAAGYFSGQSLHSQKAQALAHTRDTEQYNLALADIEAGRFKVAISRLSNILQNEPDFPGALEKQQQALAAINATPTPLPTETPIPSPTPDVSRAEQLLNQAEQQFTDKDYPGMITTLLTLKTTVPGYEPVRVDGLIWTALRYNGVHLIKDTNRLTEGLYYLDLAANYAPLDKDASVQADFANLFLGLYQNAYYYETLDIEKSMNYFAQVVGMRPYYTDRLIKDYGDIVIANGKDSKGPCAAQELYLAQEQLNQQALDGYEPFAQAYSQAQQECTASRPVPTVPAATDVPTATP